MKLKEIYSKYPVPPNLQEHMMRVAGVAKIISENWMGALLDEDIMLKACLVHDIGNLLKFDLETKAHFLGKEQSNVDYWKKLKEEMAQKYGADEHVATASICQEINLEPKALWIVNNWGFGNFDKVLKSENWEYKICVYSDHRVGPFGIVSLKERFAEQRKRYQEYTHKSQDLSAHLSDKSEFLANCAFEVEKQIQEMVSKDLSAIGNAEVEQGFSYFSEFNF